MKQGSTDDPFADDGEDPDADVGRDGAAGTDAPDPGPDTDASTTGADDSEPTTSGSEDRPDKGRLPYIYARESVKDGRQQRPIFLRDDVENGIPDLVDELEETFGENVYRTDVMEAAVELAQEHPDLVAEKLGEWGYGWE